MVLRKREGTEIGKGNTRSHCVDNSL